MPAGQGLSIPATVTVGGQTASLSSGLDYAAPTITTIAPTTADTGGGTRVVIVGGNFGTLNATRYVRWGGISNIESLNWRQANHTHIILSSPAGQGTLKLHVWVNGQRSHPSFNFSYDPPVIRRVRPLSGTTEACRRWEDLSSYLVRVDSDASAERRCEDKEYLTITGESFGTRNLKARATSFEIQIPLKLYLSLLTLIA